MSLKHKSAKLFYIFAFIFLNFLFNGKIFAFTLIDVRNLDAQNPMLLSVAAASGLENRDAANVYIVKTDDDEYWRHQLSLYPTTVTTPFDFIAQMIKKYPVILYSKNDIKYLPSIVTIAGVYDAVPIEMSFYNANFSGSKVLFNFSNHWSSMHQAVKDTANFVLKHTSTLAVEPGEKLQKGYLVDLIMAKKMFVEYLEKGCIPLTDDNKLLKKITEQSPWERPVKVYGYNDMNMVLGGYVFEAQTNCVNVLGQVPTAEAVNLSFLGNYKNEYKPLVRPQAATPVYDPNKIYINFVYGDMDNIDFVKGFAHNNVTKRQQMCNEKPELCFPLTWTLSPNLRYIAPQIARWYYDNVQQIGNDDFILPPSGVAYSYPGLMPDDVQSKYVNLMSQEMDWMQTSGSIHWEWQGSWHNAFKNYFPKFNALKNKNWAFFLNNVPWPIPIISTHILPHQDYKWVSENTVVFKPKLNWEPPNGAGGTHFSAPELAQKINNYKPGTVAYIYVIQTTSQETIFDLNFHLDKTKVSVVNARDLIDLSKQRDQFLSR